jgi:C-terminal processing protease CtpA/Prc
LEVAPNSPAFEMGIKSGDMLLQVNEKKINNEQDILTAAKEGLNYISFKLRRGLDKLHDVSYNKLSGEKRLGIVFVPRNVPGDEMITKFDEDKFKEVFDKAKDKENEE